MLLKDLPIRRKLITVILLTSGTVLLIACCTFFAYEYFTFRQNAVREISTLGMIISNNSTASLAFDDKKDATEILSALKAEPQIVAACLYNKDGKLFAWYPQDLPETTFPKDTGRQEFKYDASFLSGYQAVKQDGNTLGYLYIKSNINAIYDRLTLYIIVAAAVIAIACLVALLLSRLLQKEISKPILSLVKTAKVVSEGHDYSVRAEKIGKDELGELTDAFNQMLTRIETQTQEIKDFNQQLEHKVAERTHELSLVNQELESFSYSISHDLRAPLRIINGYANIFMEDYVDQLDDNGKNLATRILLNSKKMGQLIDDLLEFSRLGRKPLTKTGVSMEELVESIWEEYVKAEGNRKINLIKHPLPDSYADIHTIKQVWVNLISNALKYTRQKPDTVIEIGAEEQVDRILYYVKDNGAGFDMTYYNKLFNVFQRLHTKEDFEGTGVGLAIVKKIIDKHGGTIWGEAEPEKGATFYFTLPKSDITENGRGDRLANTASEV